MGFAGKVWRLLVGIKDALALLALLLFFTLLFMALSARPSPGVVRDGALLLHLDGAVVEEVSPVDPFQALMTSALPTREYAARDLVRAIDAAAKDGRIKAIALDLTTFAGGGQVHLTEVGEALERFRRTDKPVLAYAVVYTDDAIMLAAHADEVWVDPLGGAVVQGPGGYQMYFGEALERFGIKAHVFRVGTFKSAVEPFLGNKMSPAARENTEAYVSALWEEWQAHVKQARPGINLAALTSGLMDLVAAQGDFARSAIAAGAADKIGTHDEWGDRLAELAGEDEWDDRPGAFAKNDLDPWLAENPIDKGSRNLTGGGGEAIGVITVSGEISDGEAGPGEAGAARIGRLLDEALDKDLAALVVRVDSPGGTVSGSEAIRRAILRHKARDIPVVISMGNYAASGGYWIATTGDRIFAQPETVTGSIGLFMVFPTFEELAARYGITSDGVTTTPLSGQPALVAGITPETEALIQAETSALYNRFLSLVAQSRGITAARADELGQGRVWTGGAARQLGLVDQFGGLDEAVAWAGDAAGLEPGKWRVRHLADPPDPFDTFVAGMVGSGPTAPAPGGVSTALARQEQDMGAQLLARMQLLFGTSGAQAMCLECMALGPSAGRPSAAIPQSLWSAIAARLIAH